MVGRKLGLVRKHAKAITATKVMSCIIFLLLGGESRWSNTSFSITFWAQDDDDDDSFDNNSPGCLPINISNANTPKL